MKINSFWGDLTDISAKKEALESSRVVQHAECLHVSPAQICKKIVRNRNSHSLFSGQMFTKSPHHLNIYRPNGTRKIRHARVLYSESYLYHAFKYSQDAHLIEGRIFAVCQAC